jgi:uncharacterized protein
MSDTGEHERSGLDDRERQLDRRVMGVWQVSTGTGLLILLLPLTGIALALLGMLGLVVPVVGLVILVLGVTWYPRARYERWRWRLTPLALELRSGVLVRRHTAVPYFRIQQIDVTRGPLERWLGLATLRVTTASASGSASLPGITVTEAPTVRTELLARTAAAAAEHGDGVIDAV